MHPDPATPPPLSPATWRPLPDKGSHANAVGGNACANTKAGPGTARWAGPSSSPLARPRRPTRHRGPKATTAQPCSPREGELRLEWSEVSPQPESGSLSCSGMSVLSVRCSRRRRGGRFRPRSWRRGCRARARLRPSRWLGRGGRLAGWRWLRPCRVRLWAIISVTIGVSIVPGQIALMRIPRGAYSKAALLVSPMTPCFEAW